MRRVNYDEPIKNLPDAFAKDKDSNNYKLLQIHKMSTDRQLKVLRDMSDAFNIDNAYGETLDLWFGEKFGLKRGQMSDEQYRIRLKCKQMQNTTDGSFPKLVKALAFVLQCNVSDIHIVESDTSNSIMIKELPISTLQNAGFTVSQINELIISLLSVGVHTSEFVYAKQSKINFYVGGFAALSKKYQLAYVSKPQDGVLSLMQYVGGIAGLRSKYQTTGIKRPSEMVTVPISVYTGGFTAQKMKYQTAQIKEPKGSTLGLNQYVGGFVASAVKYQTISI